MIAFYDIPIPWGIFIVLVYAQNFKKEISLASLRSFQLDSPRYHIGLRTGLERQWRKFAAPRMKIIGGGDGAGYISLLLVGSSKT